ncbi:MAG: Lrp/AsnC family transcriptional regulator [Candidatus Diapherotrites archaeon]|nr:Lrp/AsnC family transcriptional regulator [Candidatus Diapherotrites archaeon]
MAQKMKADDIIRLNILQALLEGGSVQPNIRRIKVKTKYHLATIKASLDFLQKEGLLVGYGPKIAFWKLGYKLEAVELLQLDFSRQDLIEQYLKAAEKDPHVYALNSIMGSGNFNVISSQFYSDVESYHKNLQERYVKKIPNYYDVVKDRQVFYLTEPTFKRGSRTDSIIEIMRKKAGLD